MKRFFYGVIVLIFATLFSTTGCTEKTGNKSDSICDSIFQDSLGTDTLETLLEETAVPKAADGLFDDFFFNFAANRKLQLSRIAFPLPLNTFGTLSTISKEQWKPEHFFMRQGFYTQVAGSYDDLESSKNRNITVATVEKVLMPENSVMQYIFRCTEGLWLLKEMRKQRLEENVNGEFYEFYNKFMRDSLFRQNSLAENVEFSGPDPDDDFSRIEGTIMAEQFSMFVPEIPRGTIYNIIYGKQPSMGNQRILVIRGVSNGFEIEMIFTKHNGRYLLTALNT